jgi:transposase-like protein
MRTDCDEIELSDDVIGSMGPLQIFPDGTKFKGQPLNGQAVKGDLKTIIGVTTDGNVFPLGSYTNESWESINKQWKEKKLTFPDGSVVICDGEPGLAESFVDQVEDIQRCHWHIGRDLYHSMWQNGATAKEVKPLRAALCGALAIELPEGDYQEVSEAEKDQLEEKMERTENAIDELIRYLHNKKYEVASNYILNAKRGMFSYIKRWLKYGLICPRASSLIERVTRELARRLKRMAYNWSDKGAGKIARIILKKFTNEKEWELYWKKKMRILGNVYFSVGNYKLSQNFAH